MKTNALIGSIRKIRKDISAECEHNSKKLIQHYIEYQKQYKDRLYSHPAHKKVAV